MEEEDSDMQEFIGQRVKEIRSATKQEYERIYQEEGRPLMVAELENKAKLYLLSEEEEDTRDEERKKFEGDLEDREIAIAETPNGEIIEIPGE